jgi:hypothetical protein
LLSTKGARTGQNRTTPMVFHKDGDRLLVIASRAMLKDRYPFFAEHETKTSREIPVVALMRAAAG